LTTRLLQNMLHQSSL